MMNIRDYFLINKTKKVNKLKILDLLGFESDSVIESSSYTEEPTEILEELNQETFEDNIEQLLNNILSNNSEFLEKKENLKKLNYKNTWTNVHQKILNIINEN